MHNGVVRTALPCRVQLGSHADFHSPCLCGLRDTVNLHSTILYCTCTCTCTVQCSVPMYMYTALRSDSLCPTLAVLKAAACCPAVCSVPASTFASAKTIIFGKTHIACTCTLSRPGVRLFEIQIRHCHRPRFKGGLPDNSLMFLAKNGSARCVDRDFEVVNERETCVC
jgi:hypothetical protein